MDTHEVRTQARVTLGDASGEIRSSMDRREPTRAQAGWDNEWPHVRHLDRREELAAPQQSCFAETTPETTRNNPWPPHTLRGFDSDPLSPAIIIVGTETAGFWPHTKQPEWFPCGAPATPTRAARSAPQ